MLEKRKQGRKSPQFFIGVYDKEKTRQVGRIVNVSSKGLMIIGKHEFRRYADYNISLKLPSEIDENSQIVFDAQCRWCERGGRSKLYTSGLEITNISPENSKLFSQLLEDSLIDDDSGVSQLSVVIESES